MHFEIRSVQYILGDESGFILAMVMIFFLIMTIFGFGFLELGRHEMRQTGKYVDRINAFYHAEGGIQKGMWLLNQASLQRPVREENVEIMYNSDQAEVLARGKSGKTESGIKVNVERDHAFRHLISFRKTKKIKKQDVVLSYIDGADPEQINYFPFPRLSYFESIADSIIKPTKGSPAVLRDVSFRGILYVDGACRVETGTKLRGTLVSTDVVKVTGDVRIEAAQVPQSDSFYPAYFPAVVSGSGHPLVVENGGRISGAVYSPGTILIDDSVCSGPLVAEHVKINRGSTVSDHGKSIYYHHPPGFTYSGKKSGNWRIKPGSWQRF